jgi:ribose transport system ATP-binding protein
MNVSERISLRLKNVTRRYPGVVALNHYSIEFLEGECHALVGENGAGKSTLIKVISGAIKPDEGTIEIDGKTYSEMQPAMARELGIEVIYQEFNLVETLTAAENIFLGCKTGRFVNRKEMNEAASRLFQQFEIDINPNHLIRDLSPAQQQIVEIVKAVSKNARILIMDEPTAPLTMKEVDLLFKIIRRIKAEGVTVIYISHRLDEIFEIADRVTVMRDGNYISTKPITDTNKKKLIAEMVGRELQETYPGAKVAPGETALEVRGLSGNGCQDVSFQVQKGEILGIAGLVGAGRTELMRIIYGADRMEGGTILVDGTPMKIRCPRDAIQNGIGLIPEDRKNQGCFLSMDVAWNISLMNIKSLRKMGTLSNSMIRENAERFVRQLHIKVPDIYTRVSTLSGGNQQKVALAKTLAAKCRILIFDEPTRGIDVGAKQEIYRLMRDYTDQGNTILMISSDMEELLGMSDRILVIRNGRKAGELQKDAFSQVRVLEYASGMIN